jgi:hypothetical protein
MRVPASAYSSVCLSVYSPENSLHSENDDNTIPKAVYMKRQIHAKICLVCREFTLFLLDNLWRSLHIKKQYISYITW